MEANNLSESADDDKCAVVKGETNPRLWICHRLARALHRDQGTTSGLMGLSDHMVWCPKLSGVRPSNAKAGVMHIRVEEPTFPMVTEQGALPQVLALLAQIGGSISLLTTIFFLVWVRRFPDSEVTNTYEARTLAGFSSGC